MHVTSHEKNDAPGDAGWLMIGDAGVVLDCNERFCAMMCATREEIVRAGVLSITAPADHARCIDLYRRIKRDGQPFTTVKRIIRMDGTHCWVRIDGASPSWTPVSSDIHMRIIECAAPEDWIEPELLLAAAQGLARTQAMRIESFGPEMFADRSWEILLAAYISEAKGTVLTTALLHAAIGIPVVSASRWLRFLAAQQLIEFEEPMNAAFVTSAIRLTGAAHDKFERFLSRVCREHADATRHLVAAEARAAAAPPRNAAAGDEL